MSFDDAKTVQRDPENPGETQVIVPERVIALAYHGGPIVIIGLDDAGQVQVTCFPSEPCVTVDHDVVKRIQPYLKDSVLLCEYFLDELYVWGVADLHNEVMTSMLATEMAAEALKLRVLDRIKAYQHVYDIDKVPDVPETALSRVIFRPEKAFPLNDLGERVQMKFLLNP
jgi:hypothetical protein